MTTEQALTMALGLSTKPRTVIAVACNLGAKEQEVREMIWRWIDIGRLTLTTNRRLVSNDDMTDFNRDVRLHEPCDNVKDCSEPTEYVYEDGSKLCAGCHQERQGINMHNCEYKRAWERLYEEVDTSWTQPRMCTILKEEQEK